MDARVTDMVFRVMVAIVSGAVLNTAVLSSMVGVVMWLAFRVVRLENSVANLQDDLKTFFSRER